MKKQSFLSLILPFIAACASAQTATDSIAADWERQLDLNEVVIVARRPVIRQQEGKLVYLVKNDPYAKGLDGISLLDRVPRVSAENGTVSVAGKGNVRYIIDGLLMELDAQAMQMRLKSLRADNIEKIELLTTPPSRYAVEPNTVYISITTRDETLGTRGNLYGSLNQGNKLREYFSGSVSHTTRRLDMSLDASLLNYNSVNDNDMEYIFADHSRLSSTHTLLHDFNAGFNALVRYKFTPAMNLGVIANYNYDNSSSSGHNITSYGSYSSSSVISSDSKPNNALTVTGFYDWTFDSAGKRMELTYNHFNRHSPARSDISTTSDYTPTDLRIHENGATDYRFNSGKADFKLPYQWAELETGVGYTDILNSSVNLMDRYSGDLVMSNEANDFDYRERIAALHLSASRSLGNHFWGKIGFRYEYTWTKSHQITTAEISRDNYGRLFPSLNISYNADRVGSFNLSYSMGMGRPNLWELNPFRYYSTTDEYAAGNAALKPAIYNNAEINYYGLGGLYAVLYTSFASDAVGYIRRFDPQGVVSTMPYNCLSTNKTGLFASYRRSITDWWEMNVGGEIYHSSSRSDFPDFMTDRIDDWSGKIELSANCMLNRQKTLTFNARFTHFFPWQQNMVCYESFQLFTLTLRYSLLNNKLNMHVTANDIFGWNKTKSREHYAGYSIRHTFDSHSAYVLFGVNFTFGRDKVSGVWRDSKESQSSRTK